MKIIRDREWIYVIFICIISVICMILLLRSCSKDKLIPRIEEMSKINKLDKDSISYIELKDTIILPPEVLIKTVKEEFIPQGFIDSLEYIIAENKRLKLKLKSKVKTITRVDTVIVYKMLDNVKSPEYRITKSRDAFSETYKVPMIDPVTSDIKIEMITKSKVGISAQIGYGAVYLHNKIGIGPYAGIGIHYEY